MSRTKGVVIGLLSGISWSLYTVGLYTVLNLYGGAQGNMDSTRGIILLVCTALIIGVVDTIFCTITEINVLYKDGTLGQYIKCLKSKVGPKIIPASILAGPLGLIPYSIASTMAPSVAGAISSVYPVVGAIASYIWLKQDMNGTKVVGILVSTAGCVGMYNIVQGNNTSVIRLS